MATITAAAPGSEGCQKLRALLELECEAIAASHGGSFAPSATPELGARRFKLPPLQEQGVLSGLLLKAGPGLQVRARGRPRAWCHVAIDGAADAARRGSGRACTVLSCCERGWGCGWGGVLCWVQRAAAQGRGRGCRCAGEGQECTAWCSIVYRYGGAGAQGPGCRRSQAG